MDLNTWIRSHTPRIGTLLTLDNPAVVEIARLAGFEWLWIDAEHGQFNDVGASVACAVNSGGPPAFVRLPDHSPTAIKRYLETGCDGIILPAVSTPAEMDAIARAALYPPRGERSVGIARAQGYGATFAEYMAKKSYSILVQIETVAGVRHAREIVAHDAVDAVLIGPYDLSGSFGIPGQVDAPQVVDAIAQVRLLCREAGKPCGIFAAGVENARAYADAGFDLIAVGIDTNVLLNAWTQIRREFS
ncbi:MAG TPA: aldolase/citrate lyase family protein [Terracidiphilus sp.]|jgi:2-keto-3-deoxy-L-rhamnonate aldolase RhmA|nr:aldolase/citrate lyase family protein [Terracidiphilus sp.]